MSACQARQLRGGTALHAHASPAYSVPVPDPLLARQRFLEANIGLPPSAPVPLDAGNRRLSIRSYLHSITSPTTFPLGSASARPFQHRHVACGQSAPRHFAHLLGWELGSDRRRYHVDIIIVVVQCPSYCNGIISSSSPYVRTRTSPQTRDRSKGPYCARYVHTVHSSPTSPNDCRNQEPSLKIPCCRDRRMWRELVISRLERWRRGPTRIRRIRASLSCTQFRYRHLEDIIHMPLLGTEHTNLPCGVLLFNIDEDCSNTYTRPPQLSLVHHNSPTSGTLLTELRFGKISRPSKPDSTYVQSRLAGAGCVIYKGNLDRAADRLLPIHLCCWLLTTRSSARLPRGSKQAASRRCSARMWESRHSRTRKAPRTCCDASIGRLCLGRLSLDRVLAATLASRIAWR